MSHSRLKGEGGEMRMENLESFDDRDLPVKLKVAVFFLNNLNDLLKRETFCDLEFEVKGDKFQAHRLVLAMWSPVMMNMLTVNSCRMERIQLMYDQPEAFQQFISFLYTGTFDGNMMDVLSILLLASTFQISLLRDLCEEHLLQTVEVGNVISLFHISVHYRLTCLEWQCADYIRQHLPDVAQHSEMKDLNAKQMNAFLGSEHMSKLDPEMKLFLLISWLTEDVPNRQQFLVMLLGHIDWSSVADDFLRDISQTDNFFTSNPSSLYLLLQTLHSSSISLGPYTEQFDQLHSEYSYLLDSVVDSSVQLGMGKLSRFQPITLSLVSNPTRSCAQIENNFNTVINEDHHYDDISHTQETVITRNHSENEHSIIQNRDSTMNRSVEENGNVEPKDVSSLSPDKSSKDVCEGSMKRKRGRPRKLMSPPQNVVLSSLNSSETNATRKTERAVKDCVESKAKHSVKDDDRFRFHDNKDNCRSRKLSKNCPVQDSRKHSKTKTVKDGCVNKKLIENGELTKKSQFRRQDSDSEQDKEKDVSKKSKSSKALENPRYSCMDCSFVSVSQKLLDKHIKKVHKSNRIFKCFMCHFESKCNKSFKDHLKSAHFNGPPFKCDIQGCSYSIDKLHIFIAHRRKHTDERPFVCDICRMSFRSSTNLHSHLRCHKAEKKYKCPVCAKCFTFKITLDQHIVTHDDLRPYLCDLCGFSTKYQSHLISHKKTHTGDVFPCTFPSCTYSTPKRSQLKAHMRSHLGIRDQVCGTCGKAFIEKSHLSRHERIHSSVKNHKCSICDYASNRADKLRDHMIKHEKQGSKPKTKVTETKTKKQQTGNRSVKKSKKTKSRAHEIKTKAKNESESVMSHIYITSVRSGEDLTQDPMAHMMDGDRQSCSIGYLGDTDMAIREITVPQGTSNEQNDTSLMCEIEVNLKSSAENQDENSNQLGEATVGSSAKREKDLSSIDLMSHISLNATSSPPENGKLHHNLQHHNEPIEPESRNSQFSSNLATGENPLCELTDMMLPGIDMPSSSIFVHDPSLQPLPSHSQQHSLYAPILSVPTRSNNGCALPKRSQDHHYPHHHQQQQHHHHHDHHLQLQHQFHPPHHHQHHLNHHHLQEQSGASIQHPPHPLIMVPNINSMDVTSQPHSTEDISNVHSFSYPQNDNFSF